ncbi:hypothetical protein D3C78_807670 [compost metagenome]
MLFIKHHVVTQIIETKFVVRAIRNIAGISSLFISMVHTAQVNPNRHAQEVIDLCHLCAVALSQIVIDRYYVYTFT